MYQIIGIRKALGFYAIACGILIAAWAMVSPPAHLNEWWKIISGSAGSLGLATAFFGQTPVFPLLCRHTFLGRIFPDIDGEWITEMNSNWDQVRQRLPSANEMPPTTPIMGRTHIASRFFYVRLIYEADTQYAKSNTIFVYISKTKLGATRLCYVFENTTMVPKPTDSEHHFGAACVDITTRADAQLQVKGVYWTNRNWQNALNTAGEIELKRAKS